MSDQCKSTNTFSTKIHVAVAVIRNLDGNILVSRRLENTHQGGLWEFPGGKKEQGESIFQALQRELMEELALTINSAHPLIMIEHDYGDRCVILDVWTVSSFSGDPISCEGQKFKWVSQQDLLSLEMPAADTPIVRAVNLPEVYAITPEPAWLLAACKQSVESDKRSIAIERFISEFKNTVHRISLIQLRLKNIDNISWTSIVEACIRLSENTQCKIILNSSIVHAIQFGAAGVHLDGKQLEALYRTGLSVTGTIKNILSRQSQSYARPDLSLKMPSDFTVSASCHDQQQLQMARELGVDFVVLSPVNSTQSHLAVVPMGWEKFQSLALRCQIPVYALGGLSEEDMMMAKQYGAQGVAGISAFWNIEK